MAHWGVVWEREGDGEKRRFVLDFGRYGKIYSHKGVRLESYEQAQALLDTIRILGQEIGKQHAVDRFAPWPRRSTGSGRGSSAGSRTSSSR